MGKRILREKVIEEINNLSIKENEGEVLILDVRLIVGSDGKVWAKDMTDNTLDEKEIIKNLKPCGYSLECLADKRTEVYEKSDVRLDMERIETLLNSCGYENPIYLYSQDTQKEIMKEDINYFADLLEYDKLLDLVAFRDYKVVDICVYHIAGFFGIEYELMDLKKIRLSLGNSKFLEEMLYKKILQAERINNLVEGEHV